MKKQGQAAAGLPVTDFVAAVSVGKVGSQVMLGLAYGEDSIAEVDMNVVKTGRGRFIEVQGTAEGNPFSDDDLLELLAAADKGVKELAALQKKALGDFEMKKPAE